MNGFFLINKSIDWTSRDVCNKVTSLIHEKKVGHTGTLDPFATGLLLVSVNKATKAGAFLDDIRKEYVAELKLGSKTDTGDYTGVKIGIGPIPDLSNDHITSILKTFLGESEQIPPMMSALHYKGQKLYDLARQGIEVERAKRKITIDDIELLSWKDNIITFRAVVSKGTYIRTLGEDIAVKLGTVGHLISLNRTKIGNFSLKDAIDVLDVNEDKLIDITPVLKNVLPFIVADEQMSKDVMFGKQINIDSNEPKILIVNQNDESLAVYEKIGHKLYKSLRGLF